jgi:predicted nucleotidyltransferase
LRVKQLSREQQDLVSALAHQLESIEGIQAVVLGGSYARGRAEPTSDIDLGILYSARAPFAIENVRAVAEEFNDTPDPVVTSFYEWGPWVNGGAWLTIREQRIDFIYRSLEQIDRVIADAEAGRYELDYSQQPPFGFFSMTYLGEVAASVPLIDHQGRVESLKRRVAIYPEPLRRAVVQDYLWSAELGLAAFARKFAKRADSYGTIACLTRVVNELALVLFALNRKYPVNDKTMLTEISELEHAPRDYGPRVQTVLAHVGASSANLLVAVDTIEEFVRETVALASGLYEPRFALPK